MRKVLSFVLVLSLVLGSFSMAFAATPAGLSDIDGIANQEAIQVNFDLGIVTGNPDGTFLPEKAVTRAEFAAMITRALAIPDSALAGYTATTFKDTAGYGWAVPYLAFCNSKGIMLGDGAGNAMPGRTINTNEAVTMALRAIGYTNNSAQLVGAWPANYVTLAQNVNLYDDVAGVLNVDKANAAQIIYNLLTVEKVAVNTDGKTEKLGASLLTSGLGATSAAVTVINGTESSSINLKPYIGDYAIKIMKDNKVIAIQEVKSTALTGSFDIAAATATKSAIAGGDVFTLDNADETEYTVSSSVTFPSYAEFANGVTAGTDVVVASDKALTVNVKLSGKTITEIYSIESWTPSAAKVIATSDLDSITQDKTLFGKKFVKDDDKNIDMAEFELAGVASLDKIKKDDIVYVYSATVDGTANTITKIEVGTTVVEGIVTDYDGDAEYTVAGKVYENAAQTNSMDTPTQLASSNVSDTVKLYLDYAGNVYKIKVVASSPDLYGVVLATDGGISTVAKLFTSEDKEVIYTATSDAKATVAAFAVDRLAKINLNKDGLINDASYVTAQVTLQAISNTVFNVDGAGKVVSADVNVFSMVGAGDYELKTIADVTKSNTATFAGVVMYDGSKIIAMIVPASVANASSDDVYGVVNTRTDSVNADNDKVYKLSGFAEKATFTKLTSDYTSGNYATAPVKGSTTVDNVVLVKIQYNAAGDIVKAVADATVAATRVTGEAASAGTGYINVSGSSTTVAIADNAVFYEYDVTDNEYKLFYGSVLAGYKFAAFEADSDVDGYEYVVIIK